MNSIQANVKYSEANILQSIISILETMNADWEMGFAGPITMDTRLVADLGFESIEIVQLGIALEDHYNGWKLNFQELILSESGEHVEDISVADLVSFLFSSLNGALRP